MINNLLSVKNLSLQFDIDGKQAYALHDVSFDIAQGEMIGIVGESGSGKSVLCFSLLKLLYKNGKITNGQILLHSDDLLLKSENEMTKVRGEKISMIFQDPFLALNPTITIGHQITWIIMKHENIKKSEAKKRAAQILSSVGIHDIDTVMKSYSHQFSGGQRQRIVIAMALCCSPELLLADEPTTALDVTTQAQVLSLISDLKKQRNMAVMLVTHDFGVVANTCDKIIVMYGGLIMEQATSKELFAAPKNPYTKALLECIPSLESKREQQIEQINGDPPDILKLGDFCPFYQRCKYAMNICTRKTPPIFQISPTHSSTCWLLDERAPVIPDFKAAARKEANVN